MFVEMPTAGTLPIPVSRFDWMPTKDTWHDWWNLWRFLHEISPPIAITYGKLLRLELFGVIGQISPF